MGERIVLVDDEGRATGTAPKASSHHHETPLHLAFSSYLVDGDGAVLMTRRAETKRTWPGVWTNSCCGHPAPGESLRDAVRRRVEQELGVRIAELTLVLPEFRYRAEMPDGTVEHELCPVVRATVADPRTDPDPAEVAAAEWWSWPQCAALAATGPNASPWFRWQLERLAPLGPPLTWPDADPADLPPAITW